MPTALVLGLLTVSFDSSMFSRGALEAIGFSFKSLPGKSVTGRGFA
jgi:hypothetical protein